MFIPVLTLISVVCFDEYKQLLGEKRLSHYQWNQEPQRYDYQYEQRVCNLFMFFEL